MLFLHLFLREIKVIEILAKIPRRMVLKTITMFEEEIEGLIDEDDANMGANIFLENKKKGKSFILPIPLILSIIAMISIYIISTFLISNEVANTDHVPGLHNVFSIVFNGSAPELPQDTYESSSQVCD
jgi:hypothetical protein